MKRNILKTLLMTLAAVSVLSSCAKTNYDGRARLIGLGAPVAPGAFKLSENNHCTMTEGEQNKPCPVEFAANFTSDTTFNWSIVNLEGASIDLNSRFKTLSGTATATAGQKSLSIPLSAVDIDHIQQGTQEFSIALVPAGASAAGISAGLTLLDVDTAAPHVLSFEKNLVTADERGEARLALLLDTPSATPVEVTVNLRNGSAMLHRDYNGFKTSTPNNPVTQRIVFPPNVQRMDLPVIGIVEDAKCNSAFTAVMERASMVGATVVNDTAQINIDCKPAPLPPPPPVLPPAIVLTPGQQFEMYEGDSANFSLQLVDALSANTSFSWRVESTNPAVRVVDRFKISSGRLMGLAGDVNLPINVVAVDVDNLRQGDQNFVIILTPDGNADSQAALLLRDRYKEPNASYDKTIITIGQGQNGKAKIVLSEPSTVRIVIDIETQDGSAKQNVDYVPIEKMRLVILPGTTSIDIPVRLLPQSECKDESEFYLVVTNIENAAMLERRATIRIPKDADLCQPPPIEPPPASGPPPVLPPPSEPPPVVVPPSEPPPVVVPPSEPPPVVVPPSEPPPVVVPPSQPPPPRPI